jgi:hypothetical protein
MLERIPAAAMAHEDRADLGSPLVDAMFALALLAVVPGVAGLLDAGLLWFVGYAILAAAVFSAIAWRRETKHRFIPLEALASASLTRLAAVLVIGGIFYLVGSLAY